jgi:hypothetical protein
MPVRRAKAPPPSEGIWITNLSKNIVSLGDLAIHMQPFCSINLLDKRHYKLSIEQIMNSVENGSICAKRDKIIIREIPPPEAPKQFIPQDYNAVYPVQEVRKRWSPPIETNKYEELEISDEEYLANDPQSGDITK